MIYEKIAEKSQAKLAVLVDPDRQSGEELQKLIELSENSKIDFFFVGGSLLLENRFEKTIETIKAHSSIPVVIFPGNSYQVNARADAILFLSLVSGRNPEYLIGQQVVAAPLVRQAGIEAIPTAYLLIDGGQISTTSYMTQTVPIPNDKPDIAIATVMAAEMLGMKAVYLEAGSGAKNCVSASLIKAVRENTSLPLLVGGGIRSAAQAEEVGKAGADIIVVGNMLEKEPELLMEISLAVHEPHKVKR